MGYLKNKTFGFYLSFVAAILALIGFVMYRQAGHTEAYIEVLLLVTVVLQILAMIVLKVAPDFKWTSLLLTANAILTAAALVNSFYNFSRTYGTFHDCIYCFLLFWISEMYL